MTANRRAAYQQQGCLSGGVRARADQAGTRWPP